MNIYNDDDDNNNNNDDDNNNNDEKISKMKRILEIYISCTCLKRIEFTCKYCSERKQKLIRRWNKKKH